MRQRLPVGRQAMRYLPEQVDEDPQKATARYGTVEQTSKQGPDEQSGPFDGDRPASRRPSRRQAGRPAAADGPGVRRLYPAHSTDRGGGWRSGPDDVGPPSAEADGAGLTGWVRDGGASYLDGPADGSAVRPYPAHSTEETGEWFGGPDGGAPYQDGPWDLYDGADADGGGAGADTDPADLFSPSAFRKADAPSFSVPYGPEEAGPAPRSWRRPPAAHIPEPGRDVWAGAQSSRGAPGGRVRTAPDAPPQTGSGAARAAWAAVHAGTRATARDNRDAGQDAPPPRPFRSIWRAAGKGARTAQAVQTVTRIAQRAKSAASGAAAAAGAGVVKAVAMPAALLAAAVLLPMLLAAAAFLAVFTVKTPPADLNTAYLYITRLDAQMEQGIRAAGTDAAYFVNGQETDPGDVRIQTDADWLLLYLDTAYGGATLSAPVSGAFGGGTIQEEIDAIHSLLYSYTVQTETVPAETLEPGETAEPDASPAPAATRQEVHITVRSVRALLDGTAGAETLELMRNSAQVGPYAAMEALASPFEGGFYVEERWGWYDAGSGIQCRSGVVLTSLNGGGWVYGCAAGTVEAAGGGSVTVALDGGGRVVYSRLTALSVSPGQRLEAGDRIGSAAGGLLLEYQVDGEAVNPLFYLPHTALSGDLVAVAASQLGNVGGEIYWSWYGFDAHVDWCACFVSWCADQCGMLQGAIPKFAGCTTGSRWFKERGLWQGRDYTPEPGQLIFFNWDGDEWVDHVGIVERVENGRVYTIEGNSNDRCRRSSYPLGDAQICGYGIPAY